MVSTKRSLKLITDSAQSFHLSNVATSQSWVAGYAGRGYKSRNLLMRARWFVNCQVPWWRVSGQLAHFRCRRDSLYLWETFDIYVLVRGSEREAWTNCGLVYGLLFCSHILRGNSWNIIKEWISAIWCTLGFRKLWK